jgi:hypothetical protein
MDIQIQKAQQTPNKILRRISSKVKRDLHEDTYIQMVKRQRQPWEQEENRDLSKIWWSADVQAEILLIRGSGVISICWKKNY